MTTGRKYLILIFLLIYSVLLFGQMPVTVPVDYHPALRQSKPSKLKSEMQVDTVSLPFIDDFSYYAKSSKPDRKWWMDEYVYINNDYPIQPPSNGVATFDALDAEGNIYTGASSTFPADTLTSCPIDLGVAGLNNVFLSFFYQPQGYGDNPNPGDSLILQFRTPDENWRTVWNIQGSPVHPFKQVFIPVNGDYLYKGFQFRFVNLVSLEQDPFNIGRRGNADHWHIDYVRLDKNRSEDDTAIPDVALIEPMKSLIKGYQSIPLDQLRYAATSTLEPRIQMTYRNNNNIDHSVFRNFTIKDVYGNIPTELESGGAENIVADGIMTFKQDISNPFLSSMTDSLLFEFTGYIGTGQYDRKENDTVRFYQFFKNYFARDDGNPENGYGFSGYNAQKCAIACRYETFKQDTLQAIQIYFNPTSNNETAKYRFKIAVWRDDKGHPGERIYLSDTEYSPKKTGQFTQYVLEKAIYVTQYSPYWIGWVQVTTGFLNVGYDRNYNDRGNLWYSTGSAWQQDINDGALMIRPVMGKRKDFPTWAESPATVTDTRLKVYPNPASQYIRIEMETLKDIVFADYDVELYAVTGQLRYRAPFTGENIDVSGLESGLYLVRVVHRKLGYVQMQKVVIMN